MLLPGTVHYASRLTSNTLRVLNRVHMWCSVLMLAVFLGKRHIFSYYMPGCISVLDWRVTSWCWRGDQYILNRVCHGTWHIEWAQRTSCQVPWHTRFRTYWSPLQHHKVTLFSHDNKRNISQKISLLLTIQNLVGVAIGWFMYSCTTSWKKIVLRIS